MAKGDGARDWARAKREWDTRDGLIGLGNQGTGSGKGGIKGGRSLVFLRLASFIEASLFLSP